MREEKRDEAEKVKLEVSKINEEISTSESREPELEEKIKKIMMVIPNIIDSSVPVGKDDAENVENERFGEAFILSYEIPYHTDILERMNCIDKEALPRGLIAFLENHYTEDGRITIPEVLRPYMGCKKEI